MGIRVIRDKVSHVTAFTAPINARISPNFLSHNPNDPIIAFQDEHKYKNVNILGMCDILL